MLAAIEGPDILIVLAIVLLLFGGTRIPKLARSLGSASREFKRGQDEAPSAKPPAANQPVTPATVAAIPVVDPTAGAPAAGSSAANGSDPATPVR